MELERAVVENVGALLEAAAVGVPSKSGGPERLCMFVVLRDPSSADWTQLKASLQKAIREKLNPLFKVDQVIVKSSLPRTATNKIMRRLLRQEVIRSRM